MIVFDLCCSEGHRFEGWFGSSADFSSQCADGLVACPHCGDTDIGKAPMAPSVPRKGNQRAVAPRRETTGEKVAVQGGAISPEVELAMQKLAEAQKRALEKSTWVGDKFAEQSRAMHYGERDTQVIHGQATLKEARDLLDEGVPVAPLPFPVTPPKDLN